MDQAKDFLNTKSDLKEKMQGFCKSLLQEAMDRAEASLEANGNPHAALMLEIVEKIIMRGSMSIEEVSEIICKDKSLGEWLTLQAKYMTYTILSNLSFGYVKPFEHNALLHKVDLDACAKHIINSQQTEAVSSLQQATDVRSLSDYASLCSNCETSDGIDLIKIDTFAYNF